MLTYYLAAQAAASFWSSAVAPGTSMLCSACSMPGQDLRVEVGLIWDRGRVTGSGRCRGRGMVSVEAPSSIPGAAGVDRKSGARE